MGRRAAFSSGCSALRGMLALAGCLLALPAHAGETRPARVVSANLCADQLVLALADPTQIVSLGPFARDASISFLSEQAKAYPQNRGTAEETIDLRADLVLLGSFDNRYSRAILERRGIEVMVLDPWTGIAQGRSQIRAVAERLGHAGRGEALIARIDEGVRNLRRRAANRARPISALVLHRRGYALHSGVTAELAHMGGLDNAAARLGLSQSGLAPLERLVAAPPDFLIVAEDISRPSDQGEALLMHPALLRLFPPGKRLVLQDRLAICAGPSTPALIEHLTKEIDAKASPR